MRRVVVVRGGGEDEGVAKDIGDVGIRREE